MYKSACMFGLSFSMLMGCGGQLSPKDSFESKLKGSDDRIRLLIASQPNVTFAESSYDIEKTDSLVSPFVAKVKLNFSVKSTEDPSASLTFGYDVNYAYQNDGWQHVKTTDFSGKSPFEADPGRVLPEDRVRLDGMTTLLRLDVMQFSLKFKGELPSVLLAD